MDTKLLVRKSEFEWWIEPHGKMRVPAIHYADEPLIEGMDHKVYEQVTNVATLPGIVQASYAMPDAHWGYGFPIGGVAAFDPEQGGVVSAGGVGFDISCGDRDAGHIRFGKEETQASLDGLAQRMLRAFSASDLAVPQGRILAVEEELRGNLIPGLPDILARIDLIFETPHELVIADWKTSRSRWNAEQVEESAPQLLLYSDLVRELAPGKSLRVEFAVLTKTKVVSAERHGFTVDPAQVARTKGTVERVWRAIEAGHFYPAPSAMSCASCPYRQPCRLWPG
ncbi:MAG TPA: RtcB family protein [Pirellulaceae bacterium]|nr:RtcB family protein [Pirellulaceae bacterium]